ncbi:MAG TPA: glutamine--tRNA ligase, partial [Desulfobulbaceae bacterium]|nr:glutamine--tRNA ligase [Desulfobulbaceae bacterium]
MSIKSTKNKPVDFIRQIIAEDLKTGKHQQVITRFPPEPNGFLHIGHAKSICLNFGIALENGSSCHLRFDDTNPGKESTIYVESIKEDVHWLGFDWGKHLYYASDYFDKLHDFAIELIQKGKAYVCHLSSEEMRNYRGTLTEPGKESPYRNRSVEENLTLFAQMKNGEFEEGSCALRAKIDMASPNIIMRDPVIYRIMKTSHHRTGDKWCIYPMYDFTHCLSDMLEQITHSLCTLEFENNRALYDWVLDTLQTPCHPRQIEFARLNINYTIMSKRKLLQLVDEDFVHGWDDPRMLTLSGLRRRGYTPASIRNFCDIIGIGKRDSWIDM